MALLNRKPRTEGVSDPAKLLIVDHEKVERIFDEIQEAVAPTQRQGLVAQLDAELTRHTTIEEQVLYPFIRTNVPDGDSLMDEAEHEHDEAKEALAQVSKLDPATDAFASELKRLQKLVDHHVKEEEGEVFPKLESAAAADDLDRLRDELEQAKLQSAPSPQLPTETTRGSSRVTGRARTSVSTSRKSSSRGTAKAAVWVQPHHTDDSRWQVRREQASRASRVFDSQREAEQFGKQLAKRERVEFVLTGRDGQIREKHSYGNDPARIPG